MNDWLKLEDPHDNHPCFPFDENTDHPVKGGMVQTGKKPNPSATGADKVWEKIAVEMAKHIDWLNGLLVTYKKSSTQADKDAAKAAYIEYAKDIKKLIKSGYPPYHNPGSLAVEVVETGGFAVAFRMVGVRSNKADPEAKAKVPIIDYSSSSYYSVYSTHC